MLFVFLDAFVSALFELNRTNGRDVVDDDRVTKISCARTNLQNTNLNSSISLFQLILLFALCSVYDIHFLYRKRNDREFDFGHSSQPCYILKGGE